MFVAIEALRVWPTESLRLIQVRSVASFVKDPVINVPSMIGWDNARSASCQNEAHLNIRPIRERIQLHTIIYAAVHQ